jgi:DNA invertase Pin-like site-specific DNA recombinase
MKAVIYTRVSSTNDRQNTERQLNDLKRYAEVNDIKVLKVYSEKISGAVKNEERIILNECLAFAKENNIDIILFSELSRLGRNIYEIQENIKYLHDNKINAYFQKENIKVIDDNGNESVIFPVIISCLGLVAQLERENIQFRLNSGRELAKEKGVKFGRKVGSIKSIEKMKQEYSEQIKLLKKGVSVRQVAKLTSTSATTVMKVKKEFGL